MFVFFSTLEVDEEEKSLVKIHTAMHILKIFRIIPNQIGLSLNPFSEAASKFEIGKIYNLLHPFSLIYLFTVMISSTE